MRKPLPASLDLLIRLFIFAAFGTAQHGWAFNEHLLEMSLEELMALPVDSVSKYEQTRLDAPANVTILTRTDITHYGYVTLADALRNLPGLYLEDDSDSLFMGVRGNIIGGVQFLVNGIPRHPSLQVGLNTTEFNRFNLPIESIDRIEFIRGPMSVMYGNNAFLGVVNIITNDYDGAPSQATIGYGSRDSGKLFARASQPLPDGVVGINAGAYRTDGYNTDYVDQLSPAQIASLTPDTTLYKSGDGDFQQELESLDLFLKQGGLNASVRYNQADYGVFATTPPVRGKDNTIHLQTLHSALSYEFDVSAQLHSRTLAIYSDETNQIDEFNIASFNFNGEQEQTSTRYELEQTFTYTPQTDLTWLLGYRVLKLDNISNDGELWLDAGSTRIYTYDTHIEVGSQTTQELFGEANYQLTSAWRVLAGLRYSRLPNGYGAQIIGDKTDTFETQYINIDDRNLMNYRVAALYSVHPDHVIKFLHGTATQDRETLGFTDPEKITSYEINYVGYYDRSLINASVYHNKLTQLFRRKLRIDNSGSVSNIEEEEGVWKTIGADLDLRYTLSTHWHLGASLSWQESDDQTSTEDIGYSPRWLVKLNTDYRHRDWVYALNGHFVDDRRADWQWVDTNNDNLPDTTRRLGDDIGHYWVWSANLRYEPNQAYAVSLNVTNLFDQTYRYPANEITNLERGLIGMERVVTLTLDYHF